MKTNPAYVFPDYSCEPDHIVVDTRYVDLLRHHLTVDATPIDEIRELDLTLLRLDGLPDGPQPPQPAEIVDCCGCPLLEDVSAKGVSEAVHEPHPADTPVEAALRELRRSIAGDYGGWLPEFSSNHTMHGVVGFPQSKPLAFGAPEPIDSLAPVSVSASAGRGVRVGVLDTQVVLHPDLVGLFQTDPSRGLVDRDGTYEAWEGHATFVSGLIARQAPAAKIVLQSVLLEDGKATVWKTAKAIVELDDENLDVLNLSLGCRTLDGLPPLVLRRAIERVRRECVVVAAAGNHGRTNYCCRPTWPAALPGVVAVGALMGPPPSADLADFSPKLPWVDILAQGFAVESTYLHGDVMVPDEAGAEVKARFDHGYARWSGTSFAAATVTGAIAAKTVPDEVTARGALTELLKLGDVVTKYAGDDDKQCA